MEWPFGQRVASMPPTRILVQAAGQVCEDKNGQDTRILELEPIDAGLSDFFLVTSATNDRQAVAIADEIEHRLKKEFGAYPNSVEGRRHGEWILLDYVDFVVHVFLAPCRAFYDIERLRKSARPLTPAELDAELKVALAEKNLAARRKASSKARPAAANAALEAKPKKIAKKALKKAPAGKAVRKKSSQKPAAKKPIGRKACGRRRFRSFQECNEVQASRASSGENKGHPERRPLLSSGIEFRDLVSFQPDALEFQAQREL